MMTVGKVKLEFSLLEPKDGRELPALGQGHIHLRSVETTYSTSDAGYGSQMLLLSIIGLLDGLVLLRDGNRRRFTFVGVDADFPLSFAREGDRLFVHFDGHILGDVSLDTFVADVSREVFELINDRTLTGSSSDAVFADLNAAIRAFTAAFPGSTTDLESVRFDYQKEEDA